MSFSNRNFQFALEMIVASRNENGATLSDIQDDYYKAFGETFESMFGNSWPAYLRNLLINTIENVFTTQPPGGYTLFFIRAAELQKKLMALSNDEDVKAILHRLKIEPSNLKLYRPPNDQVQSSFNSTGPRSVSTSSSYFRSTLPKLSHFYNHTLIADNFFLELSHIDLHMQKSRKNNIERIGLCISGQAIKSAHRTVLYSPYRFSTDNVILNIGTFDLLNGRSAEEMIRDIVRFLNVIRMKNLQPILTTLAPLSNHLDGEIEERRQSFNKFIREDCKDFMIDIEQCFLSNEKRVLLDCYQLLPRPVSGSRHAITLWNRLGRQRVLQLIKREIPNIHQLF